MITEAEPTVLYRARFHINTLSGVRRAAAARLHMVGLLLQQAQDMTLAIAEILSNAIEHGGGHGEITLTDVDDQLHCRIRDEGPGFTDDPYAHRARRPAPTAVRGRGMWMVLTLCSTALVYSSSYGTATKRAPATQIASSATEISRSPASGAS